HKEVKPYGEAKGVALRIFKGWIQGNEDKDDYDMGLVILDKAIGQQTGWAGLLAIDSSFLHAIPKLKIVGFPAKKIKLASQNNRPRIKKAYMYKHSGPLAQLKDMRLAYEIKTMAGQSGSPVLVYIPQLKGHYIIGIHTHGFSHNMKDKELNEGTYLTANKLERIFEATKTSAIAPPIIVSQLSSSLSVSGLNLSIPSKVNNKPNIQTSLEALADYIYDPKDVIIFRLISKKANAAITEHFKQIVDSYLTKPIDYSAEQAWRLGWILWHGFGSINRDHTRAISLLEKASDKENIQAQALLGSLHINKGYGPDSDEYLGFDLLTAAATQGNVVAQYELGQYEWRKDNKAAAKEWYEKAAHENHPKAMIELGEIFAYKHSGFYNLDDAVKCFYNAANLTLSRQTQDYALGRLLSQPTTNSYYLGALIYNSKNNNFMAITYFGKVLKRQSNHPETLTFLKAKAEAGDPAYQTFYGKVLLKQSNYRSKEGADYILKATTQDYADAFYEIGKLYEAGDYFNKNEDKALDLYYKAALRNNNEAALRIYAIAGFGRSEGNKVAQYFMGKLKYIQGKKDEAIPYFEKSAKQGYLPASEEVGILYFKEKKSPLGVKRFLEGPSSMGSARANYYLGKLYAQGGRGIPQDNRKAIEFYKKAANQGFARALYVLGLCYHHGYLGTFPNPVQAFNYYKLAADQSHKKAYVNVGFCYSTGTGITQDHNQAFFWFKRAADQGIAAGQCNVGLCYELGNGVEKDITQAFHFYNLAAGQGDKTAQEKIKDK
ncbi:MAG: SEL1-like repeat protein, partial [Alphaproteobacteria bacterium]|nr:SEL1-like repeat protein [Alphaproteobacteria bacterium]